MKIVLSPQACPFDDASPIVENNLLHYRGLTYDFTVIEEGDEYHHGSPFIGPVKRVNGEITLTVEYRYNWGTSVDDQPSNWDDYTFIVTEGQCPCPIVRKSTVITEA